MSTESENKKPADKTAPGKKSDEAQFQNFRDSWAHDKVQKAQAHLLAVFDTDDDMKLSQHLLLMAIVAFFALFVVWGNMATLDEVTRGEGKVVPSTEVQTVQTIEAGIVDAFLVREGDAVKAGQPLIQLSAVDASSDLNANRAHYLGLLAAVTRLQAEADGKDTVTFPDNVTKDAPSAVSEELKAFQADKQQQQSQTSIYDQQLTQRESEIREMETRAADLRSVIAMQQQQKDVVAPLVARGSASKMEVMQMEQTIREKTVELNAATSGLPRARAAVEEAKARIADVKTSAQAQAQADLAAKAREMNEIKERLAAMKDRKARTELKSPVNGTVQSISVKSVGGVVKPGDDIIKIVPVDDQLIVEARVKPSDRAFIYPGQKAVVKITAYDYSIYGGLNGEVVDISADTIEDEKQQSFYRVRVRTVEKELKRRGQVLPILPGMVASVDILTGHKTVMQYILKPLIKTITTAMTER